MLDRPQDLFGRTREWEDLTTLVQATQPGLRLGIVSGRRRQGKSYLLRRLSRAAGGLYHQAQELERTQALQRFADEVARTLSIPEGQLSLSDWDTALRSALGYPGPGSTQSPQRNPAGPNRLLVLDELPYLLTHSPELPSVLQGIYDDAQDHAWPSATIILCGSALSVMTQLLSGAHPLRGRAQLDLSMQPFDYRAAASYWPCLYCAAPRLKCSSAESGSSVRPWL